MSATNDSESGHSADRSPYRRDNWYGDPEVRTVADEHREGEIEWSETEIRDEKSAHVAHLLLRGVAPALCARTLDEHGVAEELTDPELHLPKSGSARTGEGTQYRHRRRYNQKRGYITGGETTAVQLGDVPAEDFFDLIEICLAVWQKTAGITESDATRLMRDARRMKQSSDISDEEAIKRLVSDVISPGSSDS